MFEYMIFPVVAIGLVAAAFGGILGFAAKKLAVKADPLVENIFSVLPNANCGGCGYAGCFMFAEKIAAGEADYKGCPVGGAAAVAAIAKCLGVEAELANKKVAFVKCNGLSGDIRRNYIYDGPVSCVAASQLATGGNKSCAYSCIGLASCKHACGFGAIDIIDGVAVVNREKCTSCGKCVEACPKKLIELVPEKSAVQVLCNCKDVAKVVKQNCRAGCVGCKLCEKTCEAGAITVTENIAHIDYEKCTLCMACVNKCPTKAIRAL